MREATLMSYVWLGLVIAFCICAAAILVDLVRITIKELRDRSKEKGDDDG